MYNFGGGEKSPELYPNEITIQEPSLLVPLNSLSSLGQAY